MTRKDFAQEIIGKEIHIRLVTNDLLESDIQSMTVIAMGSTEKELLINSIFEKKHFSEYGSRTSKHRVENGFPRKAGEDVVASEVFVLVEEKHGSISADDVRYVDWLAKNRGQRPRIIMIPEIGHINSASSGSVSGSAEAKTKKNFHKGFWSRQWRRIRAIPAPITKDAAIAAIPRTIIPVSFSLLLAYIKRNELAMGRVTGYVGLAFGFAVGFALFNQTVLNWITFWSGFTRDVFEPYIGRMDQWLMKKSIAQRGLRISRYLVDFIKFVSARGDVLIAAPLIGIGCSYFARLVLGPVGETVSVLTLKGFLLVCFNVIVGSIAGGPYTQVVAHLRAVGKISNRASMYLGIVETIKMELGRVADFGMQTFYNVIQVTLAVVFWILLLVVDRFYIKPEVYCLESEFDVEFARNLFFNLRARDDIKKAILQCRLSS